MASMQVVKVPIMQRHSKTTQNFRNVGVLTSKVKEIPGIQEDTKTDTKKIEIKKTNETNLHVLDKRIRGILGRDQQKLDLYKAAVRAVMTSYSLIVPYRESDMIECTTKQTNRDQNDQVQLLVNRYIEVARKFADVVTDTTITDESRCYKCEEQMEDCGDVFWCSNCLETRQPPMKTDVAPTGETTTRTTNDKLNHFKLLPQLFQGSEDYYISEEHIAIIEDYCKRYDINLETIDKDTLLDVLDGSDLRNELGDHINLLHHVLTGIELPNIIDIEDNIVARHQEVLTMYNSIKNTLPKRYPLKSWFFFYQYLIMEGYQINQRDLPISKQKESLEWHNNLIKRVSILLKERGSRFRWEPVVVT